VREQQELGSCSRGEGQGCMGAADVALERHAEAALVPKMTPAFPCKGPTI
jgi:hypothetical protein